MDLGGGAHERYLLLEHVYFVVVEGDGGPDGVEDGFERGRRRGEGGVGEEGVHAMGEEIVLG